MPNMRHSEKHLDLFPLTPSPKWDFDYANVWRLPDAHGEEIVRAVYLDEQVYPLLMLPFLNDTKSNFFKTVENSVHRRRGWHNPSMETK